MYNSPYATQYTREIAQGKKNPTRDNTNYITSTRATRKAQWEAKMKAKAS